MKKKPSAKDPVRIEPLKFVPLTEEDRQIEELVAATPKIDALIECMRPLQPEQRAAIYSRLYADFCPICGEAKADCVCDEAG